MSGDVSDEVVEQLEGRNPGTKIRVEGKSLEEEKQPVVEVIDEEESEHENSAIPAETRRKK